MSKLIVVVGATGHQGGSVVRTFLKEPGWKVRGITRDPSKPSNKALVDAGVELVAADLEDPASILAAFKGATAIFGVTDFWQWSRDPETSKQAEARGIQPNQLCYERELVHAKNIIDAAADPSVLATLERFVFSSLSNSKKWSNGEIQWNLHFDGKAVAYEYLQATHPALAAVSSAVQVGSYLDNLRNSPVTGLAKAANGKDFVIRKPTVPNAKPRPFVHPPQDVGPFVRALVLVAPPRSNMFGFSHEASMAEFCAVWTKVMRERGLIAADATCTVDTDLSMEELARTVPGGYGIELAESLKYTETYGWCGPDPTVKTPKELGVKMDELSSITSWIINSDWSWLL